MGYHFFERVGGPGVFNKRKCTFQAFMYLFYCIRDTNLAKNCPVWKLN